MGTRQTLIVAVAFLQTRHSSVIEWGRHFPTGSADKAVLYGARASRCYLPVVHVVEPAPGQREEPGHFKFRSALTE
jgi:hypothetical protein